MTRRPFAWTMVLLSMLPCEAMAQCPPRDQLFLESGTEALDDPSVHVVVEDFNRDGFPDIATGGAGKRVTIRLGSLEGGRVVFAHSVFVPADSTPTSFVSDDFDGDEIPDLAIALRDVNRILVYLGRGHGDHWYLVPAGSWITPSAPVSIAAGDINGDGRVDLVVTNLGQSTLSAFLGNGDGTFRSRSNYSVGRVPGQVALADLNQDGLLDAAIAVQAGVVIMLGNGGSGVSAGLFRKAAFQPIRLPLGATMFSLQIVDINRDGILDCVLAYTSSGALEMMSGTFTDAGFRFVTSATVVGSSGQEAGNPRGFAVADFDRDGHLDIASPLQRIDESRRIAIHYGDGSFGFTGANYLSGPERTADIEAVDLDGDGALDLVTVGQTGTYSIWWGRCSGGAPTVEGFDPAAGSVGDTVVVRGAVLAEVTAVRFNGVAAEIVRRSVSTLTVRVPAGATSGPITLENADGIGASVSSFLVGEKPSILALEPDRAKVGQSVRLLGHGFTGTEEVRFGASSSAEFEVVADSLLQAVVDSAAQTGPVTVRTMFGTGVSPIAFTVLPPDTVPRLEAIRDVPNDEGGRVSVEWVASDLDLPGREQISAYRVLRMNAEAWEAVAIVPALTLTRYAAVVATRGDSTGAGIPYEAFLIQALTTDTSIAYSSLPDSGYSVDNLAPPRPEGFEARTVGDGVVLQWGLNPAADLATHRIFRGERVDFPTDSTSFIAEVEDTTFTDALPGTRPRYKLVAIDVHGNASEAAEAVPDILTPTLLSLVEFETRPGYARLVWHGATLAGRSGTVERATIGTSWSTIAQVAGDSDGRFVIEDRSAPSGTLRYRLRGSGGDGDWSSAIETVFVPLPVFALGIPWPQPAQNVLRVPVSLPTAEAATLEVLDITGRRVARRVLAVPAGESLIELSELSGLRAGIYHLRLVQGSKSASRRVAVVR